MKGFIKDYLRIIAFTITGLILMVSGFYIMINYYHSKEVETTLYITSGDLKYQNYQTKLTEIKDNLDKFQSKTNKSAANKIMYNKLLTCQSVLAGEGTLATLKTDNYYGANDIYKLGNKFQSDVLNICYALHLSYLNGEKAPKEFQTVTPYIVKSVDSISNQVNFALDEIQNNSSYFYTTSITASTVRNYLNADYTLIANAYNDFASIILNLSEEINKDNGGLND